MIQKKNPYFEALKFAMNWYNATLLLLNYWNDFSDSIQSSIVPYSHQSWHKSPAWSEYNVLTSISFGFFLYPINLSANGVINKSLYKYTGSLFFQPTKQPVLTEQQVDQRKRLPLGKHPHSGRTLGTLLPYTEVKHCMLQIWPTSDCITSYWTQFVIS